MKTSQRLAIHRRRQAFTLVELLVVIAIIGVLVALLLPAIQACEAARRTQCTNHLKQVMLSMHNHEAALKAFPSGGVVPWPRIEFYLSGAGGTPFGPDRQGLCWMYQILPYLEGGPIFNTKTIAQLEDVSIPFFNCPSRRGPTRTAELSERGTGKYPYVTDYACAVPFRSRSQYVPPIPPDGANPLYVMQGIDTRACGLQNFWGFASSASAPIQTVEANAGDRTDFIGFWGVVVRGGWMGTGVNAGHKTGLYTKISFAQITDGSSNTLVVGEKRLDPALYDIGAWYDDSGWASGWDPDVLRSTECRVMPDGLDDGSQAGYRFGAAHAAVMNAGFADASVRSISYGIDQELFNRLGHRSDEEGPVDTGSL